MGDRKTREKWRIPIGQPLCHYNKQTGLPKIAHSTLYEAQVHALELQLRRKISYHPYICVYCESYHVGRGGHKYNVIDSALRDELGHRVFHHLCQGDTYTAIMKRFAVMERRHDASVYPDPRGQHLRAD